MSMIENPFNWISSIDVIKILFAIAVLSAGIVVAMFIRKIAFKALIRFVPRELTIILSRTVYYAIIIVFAISAFSILGIDLTGLVIAGGIVGIILGFALQSVTANFISGLFLFWERPLKPGDFIEIDGTLGRVVDINIMSTRIIGLNGVLIRIPNEKVFQSIIRNYTNTVTRTVEFTIGIAYKEDAEKAYNIIKTVLCEHPFVLAEPEPDVYVVELGNSSVDIRVRAWVPSKLWFSVMKELLWRIKKALTEAGIEIPFPQNDLWFRNSLEVVIKEKHK